MDIKKLSKQIYPMQSPKEIKFMFDILEEVRPKKILEIGTGCGAFTTLLAAYGSVVTIDKREAGPDKRHNWNTLYEDGFITKAIHDRIKFVLGDSTNPTIVKKVTDKYDMIIIDGGHERDVGWSDWNNYSPMAPVIAIHDISDYEEKGKWHVCFPSELWSIIKKKKYKTKEITPLAGGWGVVWNPTLDIVRPVSQQGIFDKESL